MRKIYTGVPLIEFSGSFAKFVNDLDLHWHGYNRSRPPEGDLWWDTQEAVDECERLLESLRSLAPIDHYFGPHVDQPTCWGFWKTDGSYGDNYDDTSLDPREE